MWTRMSRTAVRSATTTRTCVEETTCCGRQGQRQRMELSAQGGGSVRSPGTYGCRFCEYQKVRNHWLELCGQGLIKWEGGPGPVALSYWRWSKNRLWASHVAQLVKNPPTMQETRVQFLVWEDPPEKEMATHSRILAWRIPMDCSLPGSSVHGIARVGHDLATKPPPPRIDWRGQRYVD